MKLTYEELEAKVSRLEELLKQALEKIAKLEEQLNRNSKNSSKPPSTDQKTNSTSDQRKTRAPRIGRSRSPFSSDRIDLHVQCSQENCPYCGSAAIELKRVPGEKWQQAELPEVRAIVTEYELLKYSCKECGKNSTASLP